MSLKTHITQVQDNNVLFFVFILVCFEFDVKRGGVHIYFNCTINSQFDYLVLWHYMSQTKEECKWMGIYFLQVILSTNRDNLFSIESKY